MIVRSTELRDAVAKRCMALFDYVASRRHGYDPAALKHVLSECDELDGLVERSNAMNKIREVRGTARQYFGTGPHGFNEEPERSYLLQEIHGIRMAFENEF